MSKTIHIFGGPNGVGKSTLGNQFSLDYNIKFLNPDIIRLEQELLHSEALTTIEFNSVLDAYICSTLEEDDFILIENNLHNQDSFRFLLSYINKFKANSFCYFYYLDDVNILLNRVRERELHLGHIVSEDTVLERYESSYQRILENLNTFNEIHFYDASDLIPKKVFEVVEGSINDVKENYSFKWSDKLIDLILNLRDQKG